MLPAALFGVFQWDQKARSQDELLHTTKISAYDTMKHKTQWNCTRCYHDRGETEWRLSEKLLFRQEASPSKGLRVERAIGIYGTNPTC